MHSRTHPMKHLLRASLPLVLVSALPAEEPLQSAKVTKVVNEVRIHKTQSAAKPASIGDVIQGKTRLQTGRRSRSELRFQDDTITRVGANSIFSFDQGTRDLRLEKGTLLLQVPKNNGGARIRTATITAAITGTTVMMEYNTKQWVKIIVLEGSLKAWIEQQGRRVQKTLRPGQMVVLRADARRIPEPVDVDVQTIMKTAALANPETFGPLPNTALAKIDRTITQQGNLKRDGTLVPTGAQAGPSGPAESVGERGQETRETINDGVVPPEPPRAREGDDPAD